MQEEAFMTNTKILKQLRGLNIWSLDLDKKSDQI